MALDDSHPFDSSSIPIAKGISMMSCKDRGCKFLHLVLFDKFGNPICAFAVNSEVIQSMSTAHRRIVQEKSEER